MYKDSAVKEVSGIENDVKVVLNQEGRYFGRWIIRGKNIRKMQNCKAVSGYGDVTIGRDSCVLLNMP